MRCVAKALAGLLLLFSVPGCAFVFAEIDLLKRKPEPLEEHVVEGKGKAKILLVEISRTITATGEEGPLGLSRKEATLDRVKAELGRASRDDDVKALVLRIDSPGGSVTASDTIYREIRRFAEKRHVPVVAHLMDLGTSGAYYVALAADSIVAQPTTVTGSIGAVLYGLNVEGLFRKLGIEDQTVKAGEHKDIGSPLRKMTPEERAILERVLSEMRDRFVSLVHERRPAAPRNGSWADGRILTAEQALAAGLVDRIGYLDEAIEEARKRAGVKKARVVLYRRSDEPQETVYAMAGSASSRAFPLEAGAFLTPRFLYLWLPPTGP
ncbi:MAG: signal peptide peptidase SppA [Candidatus Binatia bacterium]|nr:MAG: signal peptide peptidase SppA [Candidatus Binatia bacterium]